MQLHRLSDRACRQHGRADILGEVGHFRIVLRRVVERDAVGRDGDIAGQEHAVVIDVEPAFGAGDEGLVEFPRVLKRLDGLGRVDDNLAALVHHFAAMAPDDPMSEVVAVAHGLAQCEAGRFALGLQRFAHLQKFVGLLGKFREAGLLEHALPVKDSVADGGERQGDELSVFLGVAFEARIIPPVAAGENPSRCRSHPGACRDIGMDRRTRPA